MGENIAVHSVPENISPINTTLLGTSDPPAGVTHTTTGSTTTTRTEVAPSWLHINMRNIILVAVTCMVCWLAWLGIPEARGALITTFISLASYLFAERATLKVPGKND